jgi:Domain of unknown function (DUF222)
VSIDHAIGAADVTVIRSVLARIPPHIDAQQHAEVEAELARHARTLDAGQLTLLGQRILSYLDQDGPRPNDTPETRRRLTFTDRDGGYGLGGWLDREAAEIVRSALSPLAAPRPTTDTEIDLRNPAQRDADALVELTQRALGAGDLPTEGGESTRPPFPLADRHDRRYPAIPPTTLARRATTPQSTPHRSRPHPIPGITHGDT